MNAEELEKAQKIAKLITGYIGNNLSKEEKNQLDDWLLEDIDNIVLFEKLTDEQNIKESLAWFKRIDEEVALRKIRHKIHKRSTRLNVLIWTAAAAIIIVSVWLYRSQIPLFIDQEIVSALENQKIIPGKSKAILITEEGEKILLDNTSDTTIDIGKGLKADKDNDQLVYHHATQTTTNTLLVPVGGQYKLVLADGTKVWLNASSSLTYPTAFTTHKRVVELKGEGYFEVAQKPDQEFEVKIGESSIVVTGTAFNVSNYKNDDKQTITLIKGAIHLMVDGQKVIMHPGQEGIIQSKYIVSVTNHPNAVESLAWTRGLFSFNKTPMVEVMNQLSRWYDVQIKYEGNPNKYFTGNIPMISSIETCLEMLELSGNVRLILSGRTITVSPKN